MLSFLYNNLYINIINILQIYIFYRNKFVSYISEHYKYKNINQYYIIIKIKLINITDK